MNNFEFHKNAIEELFREKIAFAVTENNVITTCRIGCSNCIFSTMNNPHTVGLSCGDRKMMWALREYVGKPKLTKKEKTFVDLMGADLYLARSIDGSLFLYNTMPFKTEYDWIGHAGYFSMQEFEDLEFSFIKWEDEEPWSIEELSKLEVIGI